MFNKIGKMSKVTKIALIAMVIIALALAFMWWNSKNKSAEGVTIVTPMPVSGYSVEDINNGMPDDLEEPLATDLPASLAPVAEDVSVQPVDVISSAAPATNSAAEPEEFETFASSKWRGSIL
jgi:hypothetical protein